MNDETLLETNRLERAFGGLKALSGVDMRLNRGERIGLIGPNGAGKTTLVNCICGDLKPSGGRVVLAGEDVTGSAPHVLARRGLVRSYQIANPFPALTVLEAVTVGALAHTVSVPEAEEVAQKALKLFGLDVRAHVPMRELNIVDIKQVELARLVALGPQVVFLDEMLAGLRPGEIDWLLGVLDGVIDEHGWTVVMIEHLLQALMRFAQRIICIDRGATIADGRPEDVVGNETVISAYLGEKWRTRARD